MSPCTPAATPPPPSLNVCLRHLSCLEDDQGGFRVLFRGYLKLTYLPFDPLAECPTQQSSAQVRSCGREHPYDAKTKRLSRCSLQFAGRSSASRRQLRLDEAFGYFI